MLKDRIAPAVNADATAVNADPATVAAATLPPAELPPANWNRMLNYLQVASGNIPDALEVLTYRVTYMPPSRYAWHKALERVDDPEESPGSRAACFHHLVGQSTGDALTGDPVAHQRPYDRYCNPALPEWMYLTPPEQIAHIVQRIRNEFPEVVAAQKAALYELTQARIDSLGITPEDIAEAIRETRREERCYPSA